MIKPDHHDMAIIIDCHNRAGSMSQAAMPDWWVYRNIIKFINETDSIKTIVLATYGLKSEEFDSNTPWYNNSRKLIGQHVIDQKKQFYYSVNTEEEVTFGPILHWQTSKYQIAIHELWELDMFIDIRKIQQIKFDNIYMCGESWDICVETRPIGYRNLFGHVNSNILVKDICVLDSKGETFHSKDNPNWVATEKSGVYKLTKLNGVV